MVHFISYKFHCNFEIFQVKIDCHDVPLKPFQTKQCTQQSNPKEKDTAQKADRWADVKELPRAVMKTGTGLAEVGRVGKAALPKGPPSW